MQNKTLALLTAALFTFALASQAGTSSEEITVKGETRACCPKDKDGEKKECCRKAKEEGRDCCEKKDDK
jgi:hypothetical protein